MALSPFREEDRMLGQAVASGTGTAFIPAVVLTDATGTVAAQMVQGDTAHDAVDSGNAVKIGGRASTSVPAAVQAGDRVDAWYDVRGSARVTPSFGGVENTFATVGDGLANGATAFVSVSYGSVFNEATWDRARGDKNGTVVQPALSANFWSYAGTAGGIASSTADVAIKTAAGASVRNYLKSLSICHDTLSAVTECVVKDGSTIIWRGKLQTTAIDASGGAGTIIFDPPLRGTANTALNFALLTSVTGGVFVNAQGYTGA